MFHANKILPSSVSRNMIYLTSDELQITDVPSLGIDHRFCQN